MLPQVLFGAERCKLELHQLQLMSTWLTERDGSGKTAKAAKASGAAAASRASSSLEADALRGACAGPSKPEPDGDGNGNSKRKATRAAKRRSRPKAAADRAQPDRDDDEDDEDDDDMDTGDAEEDDDEEDHEDDDVDMGDAEEDEMDQDDLSGTRVGRDFGTGFFEGTVGRRTSPHRFAQRPASAPVQPAHSLPPQVTGYSEGYWKVRYEDGDEEDLSREEVLLHQAGLVAHRCEQAEEGDETPCPEPETPAPTAPTAPTSQQCVLAEAPQAFPGHGGPPPADYVALEAAGSGAGAQRFHCGICSKLVGSYRGSRHMKKKHRRSDGRIHPADVLRALPAEYIRSRVRHSTCPSPHGG